ncbi:MAG: hypothetical protein AAFP90_21180 [Planctomycetota bacterium]
MAKYYINSGKLDVVLEAPGVDEAVIAALDCYFENQRWVFSDDLPETTIRDHFMCEALLYLNVDVKISEIGSGREDVAKLQTPEVMEYWMQDCLDAAIA